MTLVENFKEWLEMQYTYAKNTKISYISSLTKIDLSSPGSLQNSLRELKNKDADKTFNNRINALKLLSEYLEEEDPDHELIPAIDKLKRISSPVSRSHKPYSKAECEKILAAANGWRHQTLYIAMNTGLRKSEIRKLNVDDVDIEHGWIHVRRGKHNKSRRVAIADTKPLERWKKFRDLTTIRDDELGSPWLFTREGSRPIIESNIVFKTIEDQIDIKITMHRFRAFYATELYRRTKDAILVKEQLGHSSLETTMKYIQQFSHERAESIRDVGRFV